MENYKIVGRLGEGAHGFVIKAIHIPSGKEVAIKKLTKHINSQDNNLVYNLREVQAMQHINHKHVVQLLEVVSMPGGIGLVLEFMIISLAEIINDPERELKESVIKAYFIMLTLGIEYMHAQKIMHRDLKPANLLLDADGILKIADFGLARVFEQPGDRTYSHQVATRWYRAPELLWGAREYTEAIDMWSVGCILGEMITRSPLFPGLTDIEQLSIVLHALGTPNIETWPEVITLPDYNKIMFQQSKGISFEKIVPGASATALELISNLLEYNPKHRMSATDVLGNKYLWTSPLPQQQSDMPSPLKQKFKDPTSPFTKIQMFLESTI